MLSPKRIALYLLFLLTSVDVAAETATEIPAVSVYADTNEASVLITTSNVFVFSRKQILASGATSIVDFLYSQSLLQLISASGNYNQSAISIRGFGDNASANTLVLVDGFRLTNPDLSAPNLNSILLLDVDHIEIIPASEGTLFGDQAVGGVVNIVTRHPKKFTADLLAGFGSYQQQLYTAFVADKFNNGLSYQISGLTNYSNNYREHNNENDKNFTGRVSYDYATGSVFANYQIYTSNLLYPGPLTAQQVMDNPRQSIIDTNSSNSTTRIYQAGLRQTINRYWTVIADLAHRDTGTDGFIFQPFNQTTQTNTIESRLMGTIKNHIINLGGYVESDRYQLLSQQFGNNTKTQQPSLFIQDVIGLTPKLELTLGARAAWQNNNAQTNSGNDINFTDNAFVTEQGLSYQLNKALRLYVRRDGNFRFPKADENTFIPTNAGHLDAQIGVSYETGMEWQQAGKDIKVSIYQLRLNNEIAFDPTQTATQPFGANTNIGQTIRNGITLFALYPLNQQWDISGQYSYVDPRFASGLYENKTIPGVSNTLANLTVAYHWSQRFRLYYEELYIGSRYAVNDDANTIPRISGYWLANLGLQYQIKFLRVSLRMNNLFNRFYNLYTVLNTNTQNIAYYPAPGRNFLLNIGCYFD